jgi:ATP-dependent RNA helicase RhlE
MNTRTPRSTSGVFRAEGPRPSFGGSRSKPFGGKTAFAGKPSYGKSSFSSRGNTGSRSPQGRGGRRGPAFERIDVSRFIRKAEKVETKPYVATHTFADFPFDPILQENIAKKGFANPMPIQDQAIRTVLEGKDLFGLANTGTGKTAAFLLPLIQKVIEDRNQKIIILAPTRELALQIEEELFQITPGLRIYGGIAVGGLPIGKQIAAIKRGINFLVGTPGRVKDLIDRKIISLNTFQTIVLDEADRMLDMGFVNEMEDIMKGMPEGRHTLFFSATLSPEIKKLSEKFLSNPTFISVVIRDTSKNVDQDVIRSKREEKIDKLHNVLIGEGSEKVLIFRETKRDVDKLEAELKARGFKVAGIHGDKRSRERIRTLDSFKENKIQALIATDVAARGLDIPNVTHVINYDLPQSYDTYVHRIGRTGRGNQTGKALTFVPH